MRKTLFTIVCLLGIAVQAQQVEEIPAELVNNAFSVVVDNNVEFICESNKSGIHKETLTVTILNEKGKSAGHFLEFCDKFTSLRKFSGEVFDKSGRSMRKIKKSDLQMTEYSNGLSTDDYVYYYECSAPSYPYTVKYEWEIKRKDGIISYPVFMPQTRFNQSVVKATYQLTASSGIEPRYRILHSDIQPEIKTVPNGTQYLLTFSNLKALESERYGPSIRQLAPHAFFNPTDFFFEGTQGSMSSWNQYGHWAHGLLQNRDILPPAFQQKLKEMTAECTSNREKVKVLYDYLANTTRYVSIQLGIGGFQPMTAADVHKTGFGDCKALSNYMMAMLKVVGIPSCYAEISTSNARILKDYVSLNQTNHAILQVPLENDTLWLECTNARLPFGYIHNNIAAHDALLITEEGGILCTLPSYPDSLNTQTTVAEVKIDPMGKAVVHAKQTSYLSQYEDIYPLMQLEPAKQREFLKNDIRITQASIADVNISENKEIHPSITVSYTVNANQYGNKTGNRLFIPANIFRNKFKKLPKKERENDIYVKYGYLDTDSIHITLPKGYVIESLPKSFATSGTFGNFETTYKQTEDKLLVVQRFYFKSGKYNKKDYEQFSAFHNLVSNEYDAKIIIRKEQ
ncbi:transglutaminase family protein [Bacteroides sp. OttesenSCG-928-E20]|nr:transglutaminase family protein [Bacteroides sp. OttesenSCG-928-N06]MDL2299308.1 transglutaminase family protein [Bacteroides sp. OttesenSCG-928-E20]